MNDDPQQTASHETSDETVNDAHAVVASPISFFERYLSVWVFLCIAAGISFGQFFPSSFHFIASLEIANVNLVVGLLVWIMIIPMLMKIDFAALPLVRQHVRGIAVTLFVNWLVKPFSMAFFATVQTFLRRPK